MMRKIKLNINNKAITSASVKNEEVIAIVVSSEKDKTEIRFSGSKDREYINWHTQEIQSGDVITITFNKNIDISSSEEEEYD